VSFKFGGVDKHTVCLFVCFCLYNFFFAMLLTEHDLHCNYGLHAISVFNLFEYDISLEILMFDDSCVGLERLYLFDFFHMHTSMGFVRYEI
jgi:hypothetical protein